MGNKYDSNFKSEVALMALREEFTILEISKRYKLHPSVVKRWKSEALQGLKMAFENKQKSELEASELKIEHLERKVGQVNDPRRERRGIDLEHSQLHVFV